MKERRAFARLDKKSLIEFKELQHPITEKKYSTSNTKDISGSGLLFQSNKKYDIGTLLHLKVVVTGWQKERPGFKKFNESAVSHPISIISKVVRVEEIEEEKLYDIGVQFINFYEDDAAGLVNFIKKNLEK